MLLARSASRIALAILGVALLSSSSSAVDIFERHVIDNGKQKIIIAKIRRTPLSTDAILGIQKIVDVSTGVAFKTIFGSVWSVELRSLDDPGSFPPVRIPAHPIDSVFLPLDSLVVWEETPDIYHLYWLDVDVPDSGQNLSVEVVITMRPDLKSDWNVRAAISPGPYGIYAVRFPYFAMDVIERDGTTDRLVTPFSGGMKLREPVLNENNFAERDIAEGTAQDAYFTYPGQMFTQFMAYYDPLQAGLYMQAEDPHGSTKNLYFDSDTAFLRPSKRRFYWYFTHFNPMPSVNSGIPAPDREADFRSFDLALKLGYPMAIDTFRGDWVNATAIYRNWVATRVPFFLARGRLVDRIDFDAEVKATAYAFRYQLQVDTEPIDPAAEYDRVQSVLRFYDDVQRRFDAGRALDLAPLMLAARYSLDPAGGVLSDVGTDDFAAPLRPGIPEWLNSVQFPSAGDLPVERVALNQDSTGFDFDGPSTPAALPNGVMFTSALRPMVAKRNTYRACVASPWLIQHRANIVLQVMSDSAYLGAPGFTMAALSGTGNFSFQCFAPAIPNPLISDPSIHDHSVGGGNYQAIGWSNLASRIRTMAFDQLGISPLMMGMEHEPETAMNDFILNGRSFTEPYDDSAAGVGRTITNSVPVPLFKFLYHDFNLWPGKVPPATRVVELYVDNDHPLAELLLLRYRTAQLAMLGRLLLMQFSQEPEFATYEAVPDELPFELQDEHEYAAALSVLRVHLAEYLIFGRALRDPYVVPEPVADTVPIRTIWRGVEKIEAVPRVVGSAWIDERFTFAPGLVFTNFTSEWSNFWFYFYPAEFGLVPGVRYKVQQKSFQFGWTDIGWAFDGGDAIAYSPYVWIPPLEDKAAEPFLAFRVVPE